MKKVKKYQGYYLELDQKDKEWIQKELQTPLSSLAKLLEDAGMMTGAIQDITSHLMWRLRDLRNGKTTGEE